MYSFTSRVRFSEIDETGSLGIPALVNYLQDCSTFHSVHVGMWPDHVRESGRAWLLSAWQIEIARLPVFGDDIRVSTWATGFKGLRATRNFTVCEADDTEREHPLVRASSSWFMFDARAGRPIRIPPEEVAPYQSDIDHDAPLDLPPLPRVLRATAPGETCAPVVVTAAHLDTNHHVNNAQYVSIALGALVEWLEGKGQLPAPAPDASAMSLTGFLAPDGDRRAGVSPVRMLDVHYSRAARLGDVICPHVYHEPDGCLVVTLDDEAESPYAIVRARR